MSMDVVFKEHESFYGEPANLVMCSLIFLIMMFHIQIETRDIKYNGTTVQH
jgi:hypothetical protein